MTKSWFYAVALMAAVALGGCIHDEFDAPPGGGSDPDVDATLIRDIADIKALYTGGDAVEITDSVFISGIVTADDRSGNFYQTMVLEDGSAGVSVRLETGDFYNTYPIGRRVFILLKGLYVGQYNGLVQIGVSSLEEPDGVERIPNLLVPSYIFPGKFGLNLDPEDVTIAQLQANRDEYQNRLIRLSGMEFSCGDLGQTFATDPDISSAVNRLVYNCSGGSMILRNSSYAEFALEPLPAGNGTLTAIFSVFGTDNQLFIRETSDAAFDGPRCQSGVVPGLEQDFEGAEDFEPISVGNWQTIATVGGELWEARSFSGNTYAQVQGFGSDFPEIESWLISPTIDFDQAESMSFESKIGYWTHDGLEVFISTDFNGCDVAGATWTELTSAVIANSVNSPDGIGGYADFFIFSGNVDLSGYSGEGVIGFRYTGNNSTETTTYQVDNIIIGTPPPPEPITIAEVRAAYAGSTTTAPNGIITGVVTSDISAANFNSRNMVIQDATGGIVVRFTANYPFALGETVSIDIAGQELSEFSGLLQLNNVPLVNATSQGAGVLPTPQVATIQQILNDEEAYESRVVQLNGVTMTSDDDNYPSNGNVTLTDGTGSILAFIRSSADFAGEALPAGAQTLVSVVTVFNNEAQIYMRSTDDVQ